MFGPTPAVATSNLIDQQGNGGMWGKKENGPLVGFGK